MMKLLKNLLELFNPLDELSTQPQLEPLALSPLQQHMSDSMPTIMQYAPLIKSVYYHSGCTDGNAAKCILQDAFWANSNYEGAKFIPMPPQYSGPVEHPAVFIDLCPEESVAHEVLLNGGFILDHHSGTKSLLDKLAQLYSNRVFYGDTSIGESGAVLAYEFHKYVYELDMNEDPGTHFKEAARLVGLADCFIKDSPDFKAARAYVEFLGKFGNALPRLPRPSEVRGWSDALAKNNKGYAENLSKEAIFQRIELKNGRVIRVAYINTLGISDCSEILRNMGVTLVVGWRLKKETDGVKLLVSLRSDDSFDCSDLAKHYGGGGHARASGFNMTVPPLASPLAMLSDRVNSFIESKIRPIMFSVI